MRPALPLAILLAGCGYEAGLRLPGNPRSIAVPVFGNETFRRGVEFDLTEAVARSLLDRAGVVLGSEDRADAILRGRIVSIRDRVLVPGSRDTLLESSVLVTVEVELVDRASGSTLASLALTDRAEFSVPRGETRGTATREALADLGEKIVLGLAEKGRVGEPPEVEKR